MLNVATSPHWPDGRPKRVFVYQTLRSWQHVPASKPSDCQQQTNCHPAEYRSKAHCDTLILCALEIFLLTYLLTYKARHDAKVSDGRSWWLPFGVCWHFFDSYCDARSRCGVLNVKKCCLNWHYRESTTGTLCRVGVLMQFKQALWDGRTELSRVKARYTKTSTFQIFKLFHHYNEEPRRLQTRNGTL